VASATIGRWDVERGALPTGKDGEFFSEFSSTKYALFCKKNYFRPETGIRGT